MVKFFRLVLLLIILILAFLYFYNQIRLFNVENIKINSNKVISDIKVTQISDFHSNKAIDLKELGNRIQEFDPNFIVLTGDIIDRKNDDLSIAIEFIDSISNLDKDIYYIMGNHEARNSLYDDLKTEMLSRDIIILEDNSATIEVYGNMINIVGLQYKYLDDKELSISKDEYEEILESLNMDYYNLLLIHSPNNVEDIILGKEDLILSGHTHGGQIRIPIIGPLVAPEQGFFPRLDKGLYEIGDSILYIDSGLGNSLLPIRAFNPVQFTNIIIEGKNKD